MKQDTYVLMREILLDWGKNKVSLDLKIDIDLYIDYITRHNKLRGISLALLGYGFTPKEISRIIHIPTKDIENALQQDLQYMAERLRLTDRRLYKDNKRENQLYAFLKFAHEYWESLETKEIVNAYIG